MMDLSAYSFETLREDGEFIVSRGRRSADPVSVLLVAPASEHPSPASIDRINHVYSLRDELDSAWATRPLDMVDRRGVPALLLEDPGSHFLDGFIGPPLGLKEFLRVAIGIVKALGSLHARGLVHRNVKPANIIVNTDTGEAWLTGFALTSRLPRQRQPPEVVAGTLAYMAPEQTGRMNRSVDSRSDLYSLGVTLYELLVGARPFSASDPMEWVHCHIARQAPSPSERVKEVPEAVSAVIMKLLAKTAEERYQTAAGVEADLRHCLTAWERFGRIDPFQPGADDVSDQLLIPEKLYGREREIGLLLAAFDRVVSRGTAELVLVSGYSGVGKSSVVNELHKSLVAPRGLFAAGKFDQYKRDIPYATLAQAFQHLAQHILGRTERELDAWREALREALGPNGQLMVSLIPEIELIIGKQPPVTELSPQDTKSRFQVVFQRFIGVFARPEHPLALFLDDLQWLDAATLDLLEDLLTRPDVKHLLLIGAYRDNEVDSAHPLMRKLEVIRRAGAAVQEIVLAPVTVEDLGRLLSESLHCEPERVAPLAELVYEKTAGNPFFAIQFISALAEEALLTFDHGGAQWSWDLYRIHAKGYTDNVVDLMVGKLNRLPVETRKALKRLACLGNTAEFGTLTVVYADSEDEMHADLREAVQTGLVLRSERAYRFLHDRVQEAAYSFISEGARGAAHLKIGRLLASRTAPESIEENIFEIVSQLNRGSHLITSDEERVRVAELNLIAGRRAKLSTAYASALAYLSTGRALLAEDAWDDNYELIFEIEFHSAECELLTANLAAAEDRLSMLARRATGVHHIAAVARLRLTLYTTMDRSDRGVEVCLEYQRQRGVVCSAHPTCDEVRSEYDRIWSQLGSRSIEELINLPLMTDPASLVTLDVLTETVTPALFTDENLLSLVICRMVNLSLEHGNSDGSCFAYVWLGMIAGPHFDNYEAGFRFGRLGYDLVEKRGLHRFQARTYMSFGNLVMPWTRHVRNGRELVRRAFDTANKIGDLTFAAYSCNNLNTNLLAAGDSLVEVQREAENGLEFARKARFGLVTDIITTQLGLVRTLRGLTPRFGSFDEGQFEELQFERHLASDAVLALPECWYWIRKLQARFFANDYPSAIQASSNAQRLLWTSPSFFEMAEYHFYSALSRAAACDSATADQRAEHVLALAAHHRQLEVWADNCPENFDNRAALVSAEIARIEGREIEAELLYERAIRSAHGDGFVHNEALANELAARFYAARGLEKIARLYLRDARYCYLRWGADGKVRQLDELHPHLREKEPAPGPTSTIGASVEHLDVATVIKVSQAMSGEIVLEKLIDIIMRTAIEHAGAERGLLILARGENLRIEAEATTGGDTVVVRLREADVTSAEAPDSIIHYVARTQANVILDDASARNPYSEDPYIRQHHARSVLCLPLLKQARLIGVLYLENNLALHVFTPARVAVLKLLASEAAISLENTRLYGELAEREARIRRLVEANVIGIFIWTVEGRLIEANEAFLQMIGHSREDIVSGRVRWTDLTPVELRDRDVRAVAEVKATGACQPYEKEYFRKDGSRVPVLIGAAIFEAKGNEGVAFVVDLSERKKAEEALRQSEGYLAEAQRLTHTGSWARNPHTDEILYWSEECFRILGFDPHGGIPRYETFCERIHPDDQAEAAEKKERATREGTGYEADYRYILPGGEVRDVHSVAKAVLNASGDLVEFIGTVIDITERKRAEEGLRRAQAELAHVTRVATMGELAASIAHEVNQPIAGVLLNAKACLRWLTRVQEDSVNVTEARETLNRIVRDGNRAGEIVARIKTLFKKAEPAREPLDMNEAIREIIVLARSEVTKQRIDLQLQLASDLPPVLGDRVQLQQVMMNLILNAIDAMNTVEDRERTLIVRTWKNGDEQVCVEVRDTGIGISPENAAKIFESFHTTKPGGMGMGLSISRSIVESHAGRLWAAANDGPGANFQFTLPTQSPQGSN